MSGIFGFISQNLRFLSAGVLLSLTSSYGQTFFISIFAAQIMSSFVLTDGEWGAIYMISTMTSAVVMFWAGALTDRFRVRALAAFVLPALALTCIAMSVSTSVVALAAIVFALRLFGQGMCSHLAVVAMARWFTARRGLALSITGIGYAAGTATFPVLFSWLLTMWDWRVLWVIAAALVVVTFPVLWTLLAQERTPGQLATETQSLGMGSRHWTRPEVLRHPLFWLLLPMLLSPPTWGTAIFFQQVHIAETKGWALTSYLALVPLMMAVATTMTLISGQIIDRFGSSVLARFYLIPWMLAFLVLSVAESLWGVALAFALFGMGQGIQGTLPAAFWAEFYGTRHIGAIKAASTSVMVLGSALGPGISGALIDLGLTFPEQMPWIALSFLVAMICVWVGVGRYGRELPRAGEVNIVRP